MRAAIYARLSTPGDPLNYPMQIADCRAQAEELGWNVVSVVEEDPQSAYPDRARPGLDKVRVMFETGEANAMLVAAHDRLSRNMERYVDLYRGIDKPLPMGEAGTGTVKPLREWAVEIAAAQRESRVKSKRQLNAERRNVARGIQPRGGRRQYGYHNRSASCGCGLEVCPHPPKYKADCRCGPDRCRQHAVREDEKKIILEVVDRWLDDAEVTFADLARDLNARGVATSTGGPWTIGRIGRLIHSRRLAAIRVHKGREAAPGAWEPIIDQERRKRIIEASEMRSKYQRPKRHYLLRDLIRCGRCGTGMQGSRHVNVTRRYRCPNCYSGISADPVDKVIWNAALGKTWHRDRASEELARQRLADVKRQRVVAVNRRDELDESYWESGTVDRRTYDARYGKLSQRVKDLDAERKQLERQLTEVDKFWTSLLRMTEHYESATFDERRAVLRRAINRVVVEPHGEVSPDYPVDSAGEPITVPAHHNVKLSRVGVTWR